MCIMEACHTQAHPHPPNNEEYHLYIISIDPGVTTAVVVLRDEVDETTLEMHTSIDLTRDFHASVTWEAIKAEHPDARVIIEKGPDKERQHEAFMRELDKSLGLSFPDATWVEPSWKNTRFGKMTLPKSLNSRHEGDAYRQAHWYLDAIKKGKF